MSKLADIMSPNSVAIVGASDNKTRIGGRPLAHMIEQNFEGDVFPINPKYDKVQGLQAYPDLLSLKQDVDFVVVAVAAHMVENVVRQAAQKNAKTVLIFSSGFSEVGDEGIAMQQRLIDIKRETGIRILGPNCLGLFNAGTRFFPTFTSSIDRATPRPGNIAITSQSGAYGSHMYMVSHNRGLDIRYWITTGNEADISVGETIQLLAEDEHVHTIMAYAESVKNGSQFTSALDCAREAGKPVIFMKVGRSDAGAAAANSHTASLAGEDAVYDEVLKAHGAYRVSSTEEMLDVAYASVPRIYPVGKKLGIVTISGGGGVLMADAAADNGLEISPMPDNAQQQLKQLVPFASPQNPVDVTAQFFNDLSLIPQFTQVMLKEGGYDGLIGFWTSAAGSPILAEPLLAYLKEAMEGWSNIPFIHCIIASKEIEKKFEKTNFPVFEDPTRAIVAMAGLMFFGSEFARKNNKKVQIQTHLPLPDGPFNEWQSTELLATHGIPVLRSTLVQTPEDARQASQNMPFPLVAKIVSADIAHKTEIGGVYLNLKNSEAVYNASHDIFINAKKHHPEAIIDGIMLVPMVENGIECLIGAKVDPIFGPMILFGLGGVYTEVLKDVVFKEAPINMDIAHDMIQSIKAAPLLNGVRGQKPGHLDGLAETLVNLSHFIASHQDTIKEVELNPVRVFHDKVIALDSLIIHHGTKN